ncbi:MAG: phosphoribosylglycinamide formyltransferase [Bacteroidota bacterium]|nr:phosphoribosylglycinamide formyltransferase [Bacteroidota bacterium]
MKKKKIAIFASGNGTNALQLINYFKNHDHIDIGMIITNHSKAGVIKLAKEHDIPFSIINKSLLANNSYMIALLNLYDINFITLSGFLLLMPPFMVKLFDHKMINIHPALLPKFGGKGMFGENVHKAVISAGETESGITIHYINEMYDQGKIIFQAKCNVDKKDNAEKLAKKVQELEHKHYPEWTEKLIMQMRYI